MYPNMYIMLVAPPGVGKSAIIGHSENLLRKIPELYVSPSSVTSASLIDTLAIAQRAIMGPVLTTFNSVQVISSELQNFLPEYNAAFMGVMTKLYDCELYEERRRTGKVQHVRIDNTQISMLAGTTPSYLNTFLPEGAWDQGFMSRTILVFCDDPSNVDLFDESNREFYDQLYVDIVNDLRVIMGYYKAVAWTPESQKVIVDWIEGGCSPAPTHNRLKHYNTRRTAHMVKLSMVACLARGDTQFVITPEDFAVALDWLLEAEALIPDIFKTMIVTGEARIMQDAHYYLLTVHEKTKKPVPEHYLVNFLKDRLPPQHIKNVIETMVKARMLKQEFNSPTACYTPIKPDHL